MADVPHRQLRRDLEAHDNRHFRSDVLFGAAIGVPSGWTVVGRHGHDKFTLAPVPARSHSAATKSFPDVFEAVVRRTRPSARLRLVPIETRTSGVAMHGTFSMTLATKAFSALPDVAFGASATGNRVDGS